MLGEEERPPITVKYFLDGILNRVEGADNQSNDNDQMVLDYKRENYDVAKDDDEEPKDEE